MTDVQNRPAARATERAAERTRAPYAASRARQARTRRIVSHAVAIVLVLIVLYPIAWLVSASFKGSSEILTNSGLIPTDFTFDNYTNALAGAGGVPLVAFLGNSLFLACASVVGIVLSSALSAYAFARLRFAFSRLWFTLMIGTLLLPFHVLIIPQYIIFQKIGLIDTYVPLLLGKFLATEAFFVFLMVQFIRNIPRELDEAAVIDGAGHFRVFWSIILPLLRPAIVTSSIFAFIWTWNDFLGPLLYVNSPEKYPLPLALRLFVDKTSVSDYGAMMAMSVLALLPVLIFFILFQRFIVNGVATQGLKG